MQNQNPDPQSTDPNQAQRGMLITGSGLIFLAAVLHLVLALYPAMSINFGIPPQLWQAGMQTVSVAALVIMAALIVMGLYGLSGARVFPRLPFVRPVCLLVGGVFVIRGIALLPQVLGMIGAYREPQPFDPLDLVFSAFSMAVGVLYLRGTLTYKK